jgi:putative ABC transport system permease protein
MDTVLSDIRYALRTIRRSPGVIVVAVISLGLGIGANASLFSAVDVFMFRPLPYDEAERLTHVYSTVPARGWTYNSVSIPDFLDLREQSQTMDIATSYGRDFNLSGGDQPERITGERASWNYFRVLRITPVLGRLFLEEEERNGAHQVAIISNGLWQRRYGSDPGVIGTNVELDGESYSIIGVLPPKIRVYERRTEIWTPIPITGEESRGSHFLSPMGRLADGVTIEQGNVEVSTIAERLALEYPETNDGWGAGARDLHRRIFSEEFRMGSTIGMVAVAFVLLIACANVANLMLTRVAGRGRELALRCAIGANRIRIVSQLLTEAMMVSLLGGLLGLGLAVFGIRGIKSLMPPFFPRIDDIMLDGRVLLFTAVITVVTGILFGLAPALQSSRPNLTESLKEGGRGNVGSKGDRLRKVLVVSEVSLSLALLVASALLVKAYLSFQTADFGWEEEETLLTFRLALPNTDYPDGESLTEFYRQLLPGLASIPGVESVGGTTMLPMQGNNNTFFEVPGMETPDLEHRPLTEVRLVFPGYFETMGISLMRGRALTDQDRTDTRPVVLVNQELVDRYMPGEDPVGKQLGAVWGETRTIVGVVENTLDVDPNARPTTFMPVLQRPQSGMSFVLRTAGDPSSVVEQLRAEVLRLDPRLPVYGVRSLEDHVSEQQAGNFIMAKIMAVLAVVALVLAVVGVYGVMAHSVSQRAQEVGIRMALGAGRGSVLGMILRQGTMLAAIGIGVGLLIAAAVARTLSIFLFGVSPYDPTTFATVAVLLLCSGIVATYFPARRATKVNPVEALRSE